MVLHSAIIFPSVRPSGPVVAVSLLLLLAAEHISPLLVADCSWLYVFAMMIFWLFFLKRLASCCLHSATPAARRISRCRRAAAAAAGAANAWPQNHGRGEKK